jgi:hypothetical protein
MACTKKDSDPECELKMLREVVDEIDFIEKRSKATLPEIRKMIDLLEDYLEQNKLIVYGGTAINNILPRNEQFYDKNSEIPDYDFFSKTAMETAIEIADMYAKNGYENVVAKSGVHPGTFNVFVDFIKMADVTHLVDEVFDSLLVDSIQIDGINYTPPDYLRMSMYLELSRPRGDISRWEKVLKRLILLNKNYPIRSDSCNISIQRKMGNKKIDSKLLFNKLKDLLIDYGCVFFGSWALSMVVDKKVSSLIPDFDVIVKEPSKVAKILKERLLYFGLENIDIVHHNGVGENIGNHYEIKIGRDTVCVLYEPIACHSYNEIRVDNRDVRIASIDTMLSFYLAFLYTSARKLYNPSRIICLADKLIKIQQITRTNQKGVLKRFSTECIGNQKTLEDILLNKTLKFKELKNSRGSTEFKKYFLNYTPNEDTKKTKKKPTKKKTRRRRKPKKSRRMKKPRHNHRGKKSRRRKKRQ